MGRGQVFPASRARSLVNPLRRLVQSPEKTVSAMRLASEALVLEVGAGPGFFSPFVAAAVPGGKVVALDLQFEMLRLGRERIGRDRPISFVQADAMGLPYRFGSFDAVLVATVLGEVPDRNLCLTELRRVLRPGGVVSFSETRRDSDFITFDKLAQLVERHAFEFLDRTGSRWQYVARFTAI